MRSWNQKKSKAAYLNRFSLCKIFVELSFIVGSWITMEIFSLGTMAGRVMILSKLDLTEHVLILVGEISFPLAR